MGELEVRDSEVDDAGCVVGWFDDRAAAIAWAGAATPDPLSSDWLAGQITDPGFAHRTVADRTGAVVGFYGLRLSPVDRHGHVMRVGVAPAERRRGVGALLLADAVATAKVRGLIRLTLFVYDSNRAARDLYARLGWVDAETHSAPEDPSGVKRLMTLEIDPA